MKIDGKMVAKELRSLRIKNNITAEEICKYLDINATTLYRYENDAQKLRYDMFEKMLSYYNTNPVIFFKVISEYNHN